MNFFKKNKFPVTLPLLILVICAIIGCNSKPGSTAPSDSAKMADTSRQTGPVIKMDDAKQARPVKHKHKLKPADTVGVPGIAKSVKTINPADAGKLAVISKIDTNKIKIADRFSKVEVRRKVASYFMMKSAPLVAPGPVKLKPEFVLIKTDDIVKKAAAVQKIDTTSSSSAPKPALPSVTKSAAEQDTQTDLKFGILGYSYPKTMVVDESKTIHAFISIKFPEAKVKDTLLKITIADDPSDNKDSINIFEPIRLYKYVTLSLIPTDSSIKVTNFSEVPARQLIDTVGGNQWSWSILATTADNPVSKLKLIMSTEDPSNYEEKTIPIYIKVDPHFFRKIYDFLMDDPKVLVVSILIPLATFFGGLLFARRKKKVA